MKVTFLVIALVFAGNLNSWVAANSDETKNVANTNVAAAQIEARYDRLMRVYVNKLKLAFVETEDAKTMEILSQYAAQFTQQSDALKSELLALVKGMPQNEVETLYKHLLEKSRGAEMMALLYDERVSRRMEQNAGIKNLMETLQAKSLELSQNSLVASTR